MLSGLFIAISLSPELTNKLDQVIASLREILPGEPVRWVPARNIHLTLKFLGDVSISNLDLLKHVLEREVSKHSSFELSVGMFGAFPSVSRPRVLWVGIEAPPQLIDLQQAIEDQTARLGYAKEDRPFSPHLTLGRVARNSYPQDVKRIGQIISGYEVGFLGAFRVEQIHLYRSDLQKSGAVYTRMVSVGLQ